MSLFVAVIISALATIVLGQSIHHPDGTSTIFRQFQDDGRFNFHYDVVRADGAKNSRQESGDALGNRVGAYSLVDSDGRQRTVEYTAGKDGFRAVVRTNERGTDNQSPADASFYSNAPGARVRRADTYAVPFYHVY